MLAERHIYVDILDDVVLSVTMFFTMLSIFILSVAKLTIVML
jgi:hypothetical protein